MNTKLKAATLTLGVFLGSFSLAGAVTLFNVQQGGTGVGTFTSSQLIYGNGTTALKSVATTTLTASSPLSLSNPVVKVGGSNSTLTLDTSGTWSGNAGTVTNGVYTTGSGTVFEVPLTFGDGLTRTANDVDVDTTQNIAILSNLTGNGFVKTSGGTGTLSIDTTTYESALTAGDGLTRTVNDFDCDTANTSTFGCLTDTDWDTFNNKQATITAGDGLTLTGTDIDLDIPVLVASGGTGLTSFTGNRILYTNFDGSALAQTASSTLFGVGTAGYVWSYQNGAAGWYATSTTAGGVTSVTGTWPVISSGGATPNITWGGLATTTALTAGRLLVTNGTNGIFDVATGTVSAGSSAITVTAGRSAIGGALAIDCAVASGSQAGCLSSANWTTFNDKQAPGFQISTTSSAAVSRLAYYTGVSGTSVGGVATTTFALTSFPAQLSGTVGAFVGGANSAYTWWGLSTSTAMANTQVPYGTAANTLGSEAAFTYNSATDVLTVVNGAFTNATSTGKFTLPVGASTVTPIAGNIAIDTTSGQIRYSAVTGTTKVLGDGFDYTTFTYATSTAWTGTTTVALGPSYAAETWAGIKCFTDAGTVQVSLTDGTNRMNWMNASTTVGTITLSTNNTFTAGEKRYAELGTPASSPKSLSCTTARGLTAD